MQQVTVLFALFMGCFVSPSTNKHWFIRLKEYATLDVELFQMNQRET